MFVRYYCVSDNQILRSVYTFSQLQSLTSKNITLFDNYDPIFEDIIEYTNWRLEIAGKNIQKLNQKNNK